MPICELIQQGPCPACKTTTHGLLHTMAAAEGYRSAADLVRHYLAKGLQVDGIDPLEIGLLPPTP